MHCGFATDRLQTRTLSLFNTHRHRGTGNKGLQEQRPGYDKTLKNTEENSETE